MNRSLLISIATGAMLSSCVQATDSHTPRGSDGTPSHASAMKLKGTGPASEKDATDGLIRVSTTVEPESECPAESNISALPRETQVGREIQLEGFGSEDGDSVAWSASAGEFEDESVLTTKYVCTEPGSHAVSFTISRDGCEDTVSEVQVRCTKSH